MAEAKKPVEKVEEVVEPKVVEKVVEKVMVVKEVEEVQGKPIIHLDGREEFARIAALSKKK